MVNFLIFNRTEAGGENVLTVIYYKITCNASFSFYTGILCSQLPYFQFLERNRGCQKAPKIVIHESPLEFFPAGRRELLFFPYDVNVAKGLYFLSLNVPNSDYIGFIHVTGWHDKLGV